MDELSEDDKLTVARARKIQKFLSQPFQVAEVFTGSLGKLVKLEVSCQHVQYVTTWYQQVCISECTHCIYTVCCTSICIHCTHVKSISHPVVVGHHLWL